ncbi:MAG: PilZ domain-containing protein [Candidatus Omnitrophota bacterium]|nr:PilZ domain-containing protein [Candidatus Omnitrophota bacterium]
MFNGGFREKREFPRFPVSIQVTLMDPSLCGQVLGAETKDISVGGVGIITENKLSPGIDLNICLHMSDNGEEINLKGKAVWIAAIDPERYRVGIKLEGSDLKPIPLVLRFLNSRQF